MKAPRGKLQFLFLEKTCTTGSKNDKTMIKNDKQLKNPRKIAISIFWKIFAPLEAKMMKNEKT